MSFWSAYAQYNALYIFLFCGPMVGLLAILPKFNSPELETAKNAILLCYGGTAVLYVRYRASKAARIVTVEGKDFWVAHRASALPVELAICFGVSITCLQLAALLVVARGMEAIGRNSWLHAATLPMVAIALVAGIA